MALRFIIGPVGSGKTSLCIRELTKENNNFAPRIYIVPEQFSMEAEKLLCKNIQGRALANIGVYSFKHLSYEIMNKYGIADTHIINDVGKAMLLKKVLLDIEKELVLYRKAASKRGFNDSMISTISELMQYNVSGEKILNVAESLGETNLKYKLLDIEKILTSYTNCLEGKYISAENSLEILTSIIPESDMIKNSEIWIDGFKSFTPQEYEVIKELMIYSKNVNITFSLDIKEFENKDTNNAFYEVKNTLNKIYKIAEENGVRIKKTKSIARIKRYESPELLHLSKNYLKTTYDVYNKRIKNIHLYNCINKYEEVDMVCTKILELVKHKHYNFNDIAIITGSQNYQTALSNALNRYNIPNFIDTRRMIKTHPITIAITALVKIIAENYKYADIFSLLKSGYIPMDENDIFLLENYVRSENIKGKKWKEEWKYGFKNEVQKEEILRIRNDFEKYISSFADSISRTRKYTVRHFAEKVFEFLNEINAKQTLNESIKNAESNKDFVSTLIDKQIWGLVCDVFDKMVTFLGDEKIYIKDFCKILESGFDIATIGVIPAVNDQLIVGDFERSRLPEIKALFIIGMNEGIIPPKREETGVFTDFERVSLSSNFFELAPNLSQKTIQDNYNIYLALTKPSTELYLSYSNGGYLGEQIGKSSVIDTIKNIFPKLEDKKYDMYDNPIAAPSPAMDKLFNKIKYSEEVPDFTKDTFNFFYNSEQYGKDIKKLINIVLLSEPSYISVDLSKELYGNNINLSASGLERFASCPYSFFLTYALEAYENSLFTFQNLESGNIYHASLENAFLILKGMGKELDELNISELKELADRAAESAIIQLKKQNLASVPRYKGYINRMKRTLFNSLWSFHSKIKSSGFRPKEFELKFGTKDTQNKIEYLLDDNRRIRLTGKIDRVDHLEKEDKIYVTIVDYKTYDHKINFSKIDKGLDIQLPLYMNSYIKNNCNQDIPYEPAGMLYYQIHNPKFEKEKSLDEKNITGDMRYRGLILDSVKKNIKNDVISPNILSAEEFKNLGSFIDKKILELGNEIAKGNIKINPYKYVESSKISSACDYCGFKNICQINTNPHKKSENVFRPDKMAENGILDPEEDK